uniref:Fc receptor-like protein 3 n=1 Tax=Erpetoichthys calabaricus TaxID=27687 RepID=A0A8C4SXT2_ERPCA
MRAIELHLLLWLTAVTLSSEGEGLLTATLTLRNQRDPVYIGEDVTLICSIDGGYTGLTYQWYKGGHSDRIKRNENMVTISSVTASDRGEYWCAAYTDDPSPVPVSYGSNVVTLSIHDLLKATLKLKNLRDHVYTGDEVTLICSIEGEHTGWTYRWYKDNQTGWRRSHENSISSVTGSDSGQYQCAAYRDDQPTSVPVSTISNAVTLGVQEREAKLTSNHTGKQIFEGDNVEMMCKVDGNLVDWKYELHKTGDKYPYKEQMKKKKFTISHVTLSDSGEYKCRAVKDNLHSRFSEPVQLQVSVVSTVTTVTTSTSKSGLDKSTIIISASLVLVLLIFLLGLLLWVYHKRKGLPCLVSKKSRVNENSKDEITVQKEQEDTSHHYQSIVEMDPVKKAGQDEVTYSELVHLPQKKKQGMYPHVVKFCMHC